MGSLLEKAKAANTVKPRKDTSVDEMDLSIAWLKGEVTTKQCEVATDKHGFEGRVARFLREAYKNGMIVVK